MALFTIQNEFRYDIVRKIFEGGMGIVYEAEQHGARDFIKRVAIKIIRPNYASQKMFIENFVGEAKLVADLIHTNIVQTYHLGESQGAAFIAMELIRGVNLEQFTHQLADKKRALPKELAIFITSRVARGLAYAHAKADKNNKPLGIVHRDVSFKNIMIAFEGDVKLTDFGIAKAKGFLTDQEGFWVPKNRIDLVEKGGYYGNFWGYHDVTDPSDAAMKQPLVWITNVFDRSPSELLWVKSDKWGPLNGSLLNFSYGYGKIYVVPFEKVDGQVQGGMCTLPLPQFPTGVMRGRFHPTNGQLYCCGMYAWAGNQTEPGGFYRVRYTGKPVYLPVGIHVTATGVAVTFSGALDPAVAGEPKNYAVKTWSLKRSEKYGSDHYDEKPSTVTAAKVTPDGKTVTLEIADLKPTWSMEIKYSLKGTVGTPVDGFLHNTIHRLGE